MQRSFSKGFMITAGFCYNGKLIIRRVEKKAKVNSVCYQEKVLSPVYFDEVPSLYGSEMNDVWIHQDKASNHTSTSTLRFLKDMEQKTGIHAVPNSDIPVKSPDAVPMNFCAFSLVKRALGSRRPRSIEGLWKACKEEWSKIDLDILCNALLQWKLCCRAIARVQGHQIEHHRWWRRGFS